MKQDYYIFPSRFFFCKCL